MKSARGKHKKDFWGRLKERGITPFPNPIPTGEGTPLPKPYPSTPK